MILLVEVHDKQQCQLDASVQILMGDVAATGERIGVAVDAIKGAVWRRLLGFHHPVRIGDRPCNVYVRDIRVDVLCQSAADLHEAIVILFVLHVQVFAWLLLVRMGACAIMAGSFSGGWQSGLMHLS